MYIYIYIYICACLCATPIAKYKSLLHTVVAEAAASNDASVAARADDIDAEWHYRRATRDDDTLFYVLAPKDLVVARPRDLDDHVAWLLALQQYEAAVSLVIVDVVDADVDDLCLVVVVVGGR
jgi:hypothetical protein